MYDDCCPVHGDPFAQTSDPACLYLSPSHTAAVQALSRGIAARQEVMALFGAPGLGKTTLLRTCQARMPPPYQAILLDYPTLSFRDVLLLIRQECGLAGAADSPSALLRQLAHAAYEPRPPGWRMVLLLDEAHHLPVPTLARLLELLRLRAATGGPLFQLVLAGLPALRHTLRLPPLRALQHRLTVSITLAPLTAAESRAYIRHRLTKALLLEDELFTPGALRRIIRAARGNPRVLNTLCSAMLMRGAGQQEKPMSARIGSCTCALRLIVTTLSQAVCVLSISRS